MKRLFIIIIVLIIGFGIGGLVLIVNNTEQDSNQDRNTESGGGIGSIALDFELVNYQGETVSLADFKGKKAVFVNFWASWCPFCVEEMPLMARIQEKYKGQYETLAINRGENLETAKEFSDKVGVTDKLTLLLDEKDTAYKQYGGFAMPYSLFIDKDGIIQDIKLGPLTEQELEQKIQAILLR